MILSIKNLHPFSKNNHFFFSFLWSHMHVYTLQTWLFPSLEYFSGHVRAALKIYSQNDGEVLCFVWILQSDQWPGVFERVQSPKKKSELMDTVCLRKENTKRKKIVAKTGPFISYGCRPVYSGTVLYRSMNRVLKCDIINFFFCISLSIVITIFQ